MHARPAATLRTWVAGLLAALLSVGVLATGALISPAAADSAPLTPADPTTPTTVSADPLPTVQINGVAWSQVVVGNTVYVAGKFTSARPAGAAAGTGETPRNNLLAYDIRTGTLITSFAPNLNAQALVVTASPDGSRIYVGGDFTTADGQTRSRIAAYSTATGALVSTFKPTFSSQVRAIVATNERVYVGGAFSAVGGVSRSRLAAVSAATGALLPWAPVAAVGRNADGNLAKNSAVDGLVLTLGNTQVVAAGRFGYLNGIETSGVGALDATSGASLPFAVGQLITNHGDYSSNTSVSTDGTTVWISGYDYGDVGNLEGVVSATADGGQLNWMADCHGDTYSTFPRHGVVYVTGHPHQCQNIGGFPEVDPRVSYYGIAYTQAASRTNTVGGGGFDPQVFRGGPAPEVANWYPRFYSGTYTGQGQAGWSVTGNDQYVVYGGEFPAINNTTQQGLVRFALPTVAPNRVGPTRPTAGWTPTLVAQPGGTVRVSWPTVSDRDNQFLTYSVYRNGSATPVYTSQPEDSTFFKVHPIGFRDTGLALGSTQRYQVRAADPFGNTLSSDTVSTTVSSATTSSYGQQILADGATGYWPLESLSGSTSYDLAGFGDVTAGSGLTGASDSPLSRTSLAANGSATARGTVAASSSATPGSNSFSLELWFSTTSTNGGRLAGFGNSITGANSNYDRMVWLDSGGRLRFGIYDGNLQVVTSAAGLNDGSWHHVVAELSGAGQVLYVDGAKVGARTGVTVGQPYLGWWQLGGGNLNAWPGDRAGDDFTGQLAQAAVYPTALSTAQVRAHYTSSGRVVSLPTRPTDPYGARVWEDAASTFWRLDESSGSARAANVVAAPGDAEQFGPAGSYAGTVTHGVVGLPSTGVTGARGIDFDGAGGYVVSSARTANPTTYSSEVWFTTTTTSGGRIIGFGNSDTGNSSAYDRHVYMFDDGRLRFGVWHGSASVIDTPKSYNDGEWHQVVATFGPAGMVLYVDGLQVGTDPNTAVDGYDGYWRLGADNTWGGASSNSFDGSIDEASVYSTQLTSAQVRAQYTATGRTVDAPARPADAYGQAVYDADPNTYWRMGEATGSTAVAAGPNGGAGLYSGGPTQGVPGPQLAGVTANRAVGFDGVDDGLATVTAVSAPTTFSAEFWFSSTSTRGGKLVGFGNRQSGYSGSYDRHVYLETDGRLTFGTYTGQLNLVQTQAAYNDGQWHHVVATLGADGMHLYVDGVERGSNPNTGAEGNYGYWRVGGDSPWSGAGYVAGSIDEVAIYGRVLSAVEVEGHWTAGTGPIDTAPTSAFTTTDDALTVAFDGTGSLDAEGPISSFGWDFGDGTSGSGATVSHTYGAAGTYQVVLTVVDGGGRSATSTQAVTVVAAPNQDPTADFSVVADDLDVSVDAASSADADGTVDAWVWDFGDGATAAGVSAQHTYAAAGSYVVSLTVTDDDGARGSASRSVVVSAPNRVPVASFTSTGSFLDVTVDGSASTDVDGSVRSYGWAFGDGSSATGMTAAHSFAAAGTYLVQLTVTDDRGATAVSTQSVTVAAAPVPNQVPSAAFTVSGADLALSFDGRSSTDADGTVVGYGWDFGDGSTATGATVTHRFAGAGTYAVTLTVTDDDGVTGSTTSSVVATLPANQAPTAVFTGTTNGLGVNLDGSGSTDPDGTLAGYGWDFGDGTTGSGRTVTHTYLAGGVFTVTLTVTDDRAGTASMSAQVTVAAPTVFAQDAFSRAIAAGWGTADTGGSYTVTGTTSVSSGAGQLTAAAGRTSTASLAVNRAEAAIQATVQVPQTPTGGGTYVSVGGQRVGGSEYRLKLWFRSSGAVQATLVRVVDNVETSLGSYLVPGSQTPGTTLTVRLDLSGAPTGTTTLRAKVWVIGTPEPTSWNVQATDSTASLQRAGGVGVTQYVSGSATASSTVRVDDLWVGPTGGAPGR